MTDRLPRPLHDDAAAYAMGALSAGEAREFEAALAASPGLQREVDAYRQVCGDLALAAASPAPRGELRDRLLDRIRQEKAFKPPARSAGTPNRALWLALAASMVLMVLAGAAWLRVRGDNADLRRSLAAAETGIDSTRALLTEREKLLEAILAPGVQLDLLTGGRQPAVQLFWNPDSRMAIVHAYDLEPAPAGRIYQLWFIRDGKPVPSVTFNTETNGRALLPNITIPGGDGVTHAAVTEEPAGGSLQPTT
ncbi:MAG: anti-sigma factor, partial [Gemmatimonadales bacterium]